MASLPLWNISYRDGGSYTAVRSNSIYSWWRLLAKRERSWRTYNEQYMCVSGDTDRLYARGD